MHVMLVKLKCLLHSKTLMWQHNKIHKQIKAYSHLYVHMLTDNFENDALEYQYCTFEMSSVCGSWFRE